MQTGRGTLTWAYVFFWCAAVSAALGFWRAFHLPPAAGAGLHPGAVFAAAVFGLHVAGSLRTVQRLPTLSPPAARQSVLVQAGIGLLLAAMLLRLR